MGVIHKFKNEMPGFSSISLMCIFLLLSSC